MLLYEFIYINFDDDLDKAKSFNKYFYSDFSHSSYTLPDISNLPFVSNELRIRHHYFTRKVHQALTTLQPRKASGPDNIGPRVLKNCCITTALLILGSNSIPAKWKKHTIIPVYKSGDKTDPKNYRPISLLCSISKLF